MLPQRTWRMQHKSMQAGLGLSCRARPFPQRRVATAAAWKSDPKYNKYRQATLLWAQGRGGRLRGSQGQCRSGGPACRPLWHPPPKPSTATALACLPESRDRQTVEKEYYREWERTAALTEGGVQQPQTARSTLLALPPLIKYYLVPDPLRYIWFFIWQALLSVARRVQRLLILQGAGWARGVGPCREMVRRHRPSWRRMLCCMRD